MKIDITINGEEYTDLEIELFDPIPAESYDAEGNVIDDGCDDAPEYAHAALPDGRLVLLAGRENIETGKLEWRAL